MKHMRYTTPVALLVVSLIVMVSFGLAAIITPSGILQMASVFCAVMWFVISGMCVHAISKGRRAA